MPSSAGASSSENSDGKISVIESGKQYYLMHVLSSQTAPIAENEARLLEVAKSHLLQNYLVADFDPEWVRGYMSGPHIGG